MRSRPGFQPAQMLLSIETQADGLGCYGVAPSVLGFRYDPDLSATDQNARPGLRVCVRTIVPSSVPQGRLSLAQDASPGFG